MPATMVMVIAHDDPEFVKATLAALRADGRNVVGFGDAISALDALENVQLLEILITLVNFPVGQVNGVSLGLMARTKRPGVKVLFVGDEESAQHTEGVGELLVEPVTAANIVTRVRELLIP